MFSYCELDEENKEKACKLLSQQGTYMDLIHNNDFKHLILTMFWSEFDKQNETNFNKKVQDNLKKDIAYKEKLSAIEEFDWSSFIIDFN